MRSNPPEVTGKRIEFGSNVSVRVRCETCKVERDHGEGGGHRVVCCNREDCPYPNGYIIEERDALAPGTLIDAQGFGRCQVIDRRGDWVNVRLRDCDRIWIRAALCRAVAGQRCHA